MTKEPLPTIVLVGRTNVGKSTLFNRLTETSQAIVSTIAGTTRDQNRGICEWQGRQFMVVDTGGLDLSDPDEIEEAVIKQVWKTIDEASLIALVVDSRDGLLPNDEKIATQLRKRNYEFVVVPNKADNPKRRQASMEFLAISPTIIPVSAINGSGTGDLLDYVLEQNLSETNLVSNTVSEDISIAILGIPNVGKSSLLNAFSEEKDLIVSDVAHTTRESRDKMIEYKDQKLRIIDTAGIKKFSKMRRFLMIESAKRSLESLESADWAIFVIDATQKNWGQHERYILERIVRSGTNVVVAANKWDKLKENPDRFKEFESNWEADFGNFPWIPIIPISAKTGWHINRLLETIIELNPNRSRKIPQSALTRLLKRAMLRRRPQRKKGPDAPYVHTLQQVDTAPPTFEVVIDFKDTLAESYVRFLQKQLREKFDFRATPVRLFVRSVK